MTKADYIKDAMKVFEQRLDELEALVKELGSISKTVLATEGSLIDRQWLLQQVDCLYFDGDAQEKSKYRKDLLVNRNLNLNFKVRKIFL